MPEHIHLLIGEPVRGTPSTVMRVLKQRVSHRLRRKRQTSPAQLRLRFDRSQDSLPRFWQLRWKSGGPKALPPMKPGTDWIRTKAPITNRVSFGLEDQRLGGKGAFDDSDWM
jgi:hypothetical protein